MKYKYRSVRIRLYPSTLQKERMAQTFGACRWFYNHTLELRTRHYLMFGKKEGFKPLNRYRLNKHYTKTLFKRKPWLRSVMRAALTQKLIDQEQAMKTRYKKKGRPRFKSRKDKQSFAIPGIDCCKNRIDNNRIKLRRDLHVRIGGQERIPQDGIITTITIKKWTFDRYEATVRIKLEARTPKLPKGNGIGIDLNIGDNLYVTSEGDACNVPRVLDKHERRLRRWQRIQARRVKDSGRWNKARAVAAKIHFKIQERRKHGLHAAARELLERGNQAGGSRLPSFIGIEDLKIQNMTRKGGKRKRGLNRSFNDRSIGLFRHILKYRCEDLGIQLIEVNARHTSKTCHVCRCIHKDLKLSDRSWTCPGCGTDHDRDHNAALNVLSRAGMARRGESLNRDSVRLEA